MTDTDDVIKGRVQTPEEKAEHAALLTVFDPKAAVDRLDAYGKWLFASAATVGALGAGFSNATFSTLRGLSVILFALAIACLGVCLVAASKSIAPQWAGIRREELESLRSAVQAQFASRRLSLQVAASAFVIALGLAALSPLVSLMSTRDPVIHYNIDETGTLAAVLEADGLDRGTVVELRLEGQSSSSVSLPVAAATADPQGRIQVAFKMPAVASLKGQLDLVACVKLPGADQCASSQRLVIR